MQINLSVFATGETILNNKLRYKAYETSSPNIAVAELTEDPPHDFPHAVSLYVPNPVPHIVKIFSTPDDSDGVKLTDILYDPTYSNVEVRLPLELSVNGSGEFDPAEGTQAIIRHCEDGIGILK